MLPPPRALKTAQMVHFSENFIIKNCVAPVKMVSWADLVPLGICDETWQREGPTQEGKCLCLGLVLTLCSWGPKMGSRVCMVHF